ncbi:intestinal mucin-like protein [Labrus bergylta]|uniref:intestinal mucin-like protein n=1 Tax=Labrus bergylta TaxID=56723 RepID=UPI00331449A4
MVENCTVTICDNGTVIKKHLTCANRRPAVKVFNENGCCFHYECESVCSLWSKKHYMTLYRVGYISHQFCEYFLVREIIHKSSLSVSVDNHKCDPADGSFCPQAVTVSFESYRILLTQLKDVGNVVYVNQKRVYPAYSNYDLLLTGTDMAITLEIPAIKLKVVYRKDYFSIYLPYSLFSGNTEGLCGTCDNSQVNECCYPNGSCSDCADTWLVPGLHERPVSARSMPNHADP